MNKTVKTAILAVVIVACLAFVGYRVFSGGSAESGEKSPAAVVAERDFYCLKCKKHVMAPMIEGKYTQMMMSGINAGTKFTCPECSQPAAVPAILCPSCKEWVPSPGSGSGSGGRKPVCPKCKKPITLPSPGSSAPPAAK